MPPQINPSLLLIADQTAAVSSSSSPDQPVKYGCVVYVGDEGGDEYMIPIEAFRVKWVDQVNWLRSRGGTVVLSWVACLSSYCLPTTLDVLAVGVHDHVWFPMCGTGGRDPLQRVTWRKVDPLTFAFFGGPGAANGSGGGGAAGGGGDEYQEQITSNHLAITNQHNRQSSLPPPRQPSLGAPIRHHDAPSRGENGKMVEGYVGQLVGYAVSDEWRGGYGKRNGSDNHDPVAHPSAAYDSISPKRMRIAGQRHRLEPPAQRQRQPERRSRSPSVDHPIDLPHHPPYRHRTASAQPGQIPRARLAPLRTSRDPYIPRKEREETFAGGSVQDDWNGEDHARSDAEESVEMPRRAPHRESINSPVFSSLRTTKFNRLKPLAEEYQYDNELDNRSIQSAGGADSNFDTPIFNLSDEDQNTNELTVGIKRGCQKKHVGISIPSTEAEAANQKCRAPSAQPPRLASRTALPSRPAAKSPSTGNQQRPVVDQGGGIATRLTRARSTVLPTRGNAVHNKDTLGRERDRSTVIASPQDQPEEPSVDEDTGLQQMETSASERDDDVEDDNEDDNKDDDEDDDKDDDQHDDSGDQIADRPVKITIKSKDGNDTMWITPHPCRRCSKKKLRCLTKQAHGSTICSECSHSKLRNCSIAKDERSKRQQMVDGLVAMPTQFLSETMQDLICLVPHCDDKEHLESFAEQLHGRLKQYSDKVDEVLTHMLPTMMGQQASLHLDKDDDTPLLVRYNRLSMQRKSKRNATVE